MSAENAERLATVAARVFVTLAEIDAFQVPENFQGAIHPHLPLRAMDDIGARCPFSPEPNG